MSHVSHLYEEAAGSDSTRRASEALDETRRRAGEALDRASDYAPDVYEEAHEASQTYPHVTLALALGAGFLLGVIVGSRR